MIKPWSGRLMAVVSLGLLVLAPARAADEPPGILWDTTSQTVMEGMPMQMPVQKLKICAAKGDWNHPPAGGNDNCRNLNFQRVGPKATWTVQCTGEMEMTGVGEMTFEGTDSYTGSIQFSAEGGMNMTVKLTGKKVGTCDKPLN